MNDSQHFPEHVPGRRNNPPICGAKTRAGTPCRAIAGPNGRCRLHGGAKGSGRPIGSGLHSKYLPKGLLESYQATLADPEAYSLKEKVAILNGLINEELARMGNRNPPKLWVDLRLEILRIRAILSEINDPVPEELLNAADNLYGMVEVAFRDAREQRSDRELRDMLQEAAQLSKAQALLAERSGRYLTVEQASALVAAIVHLINLHVSSGKEKSAIAQELLHLIQPDGAPAIVLPGALVPVR